jgi:DNA polymerase-3 subunit epsilon
MTPVQEAAALAGILGHRIRETPIAVLDFETTGMRAGDDRVVEAAVVRVDPGQAPRLVFDSLVNPGRPMDCTQIHGITDADVRDAPTFADVAGDFLAAIEGCVVAAYNVAFDAKFLHFELANAGCRHRPPHLCLMYLRPLLGIGVRCRLEYACRMHRIELNNAHVAASDALAAAGLVDPCLQAMARGGIETFGDLSRLGRYRFLESFICTPLADAARFGLRCGVRTVSRAQSHSSGIFRYDPIPRGPAVKATIPAVQDSYWSALQRIAFDPNLSAEDLSRIRDERARSGLRADQLRALHARVFAEVIHSLVENGRLDRDGMDLLRRTRERLSSLGWAPGD